MPDLCVFNLNLHRERHSVNGRNRGPLYFFGSGFLTFRFGCEKIHIPWLKRTQYSEKWLLISICVTRFKILYIEIPGFRSQFNFSTVQHILWLRGKLRMG